MFTVRNRALSATPGPVKTSTPSFRAGTIAAVTGGMTGARRFEDVIAWQRMYELSIEIRKATRSSSSFAGL